MSEKIFKKVKGYDFDYEVNQFSEVRIIKKTSNGLGFAYLGRQTSRAGYVNVILVKNGKKRAEFVHRLSCIAFIPNPENKPFVNHKNGIKHDNRIENLEWVTAKENMRHAWDTGLCKGYDKKGINAPRYKHGQTIIINEQKKCEKCQKVFIAKYVKSRFCSRGCALSLRKGTTYKPRTKPTIRRKKSEM